MTGWVVLAAIGVGCLALLAALRLPRGLWALAGTAVMLGAAGYAWQGRPDLAGHPVVAETKAVEIDEGLTEIRRAMFGRFDSGDAYFMMADAMTRAGSPKAAAQAMLGGVRKAPRDAALWTGLGIKLAEQDNNLITPASQYAFERAERLAPRHPGPPFFHGIALIRANEFAAARPYWARAVALTPETASYREALAERLMVLDRLLALQAEAERRARAQ
jgi:cytochrome c-type biogenesis protein CcmH/NrfG